jgi:integrase
MGQKRKRADPSRPLPPGLYLHGRQYRARRLDRTWQYFGSEYAEAMRGFAAWKHEGAPVDSVAWLLDYFVGTVCPGYVKANRLAPRTAKDYGNDSETLKTGIGHIPLRSLTSRHIAEYRDARAQDAPAHVRHELACLSAALSYALESGRIAINPARGVRRPRRSVRERLITDTEYLAVFDKAGSAVRLAMSLAVRTLALPADVLAMGPRNVHKTPDGKRVLRFARGKTGVRIEVEIVGELARLIDEHQAASVVFETFVHRKDGKPFTRDGIGGMFRRYCAEQKANVKDFGLRDLRAKGASDEYRGGRSLRELQTLLGHKSIRTTEIYLKSLVPETVRPNERAILADAK